MCVHVVSFYSVHARESFGSRSRSREKRKHESILCLMTLLTGVIKMHLYKYIFSLLQFFSIRERIMNTMKTGTAKLLATMQKFSAGLDEALNSTLSTVSSYFYLPPIKADSNLAEVAPVFNLDEGTLLKIFSFLSTQDLLRACQVCRLWQRLSYDLLLWKTTNLKRFSSSLVDSEKFQALAVNRFANKTRCLDLSGFLLTEDSLRVLATHCKKLRQLKLKSVTFAVDRNYKTQIKEDVLFPGDLECLDIRFSHGNPRVYRAIGKVLSKVKWLGLSDAFFQNLLAEGTMEETIDSLKHLRKLDVSQCLLLKDNTLALFGRCRKLELLSVRKCCFLSGTFVEVFLNSCKELKTLILDGISLEDETLAEISWRNSCLKHLDLGWCPLVSEAGLTKALPQIAKIQTLEYLGLCAIGKENAVDDDILINLGASLSYWRSQKLKSINVSHSQSLTSDGVVEFCQRFGFVEILDVTNCPAVKQSQLFYEHLSSVVFSGDGKKGSVSATRFAKSKHALETPV